MSNLVQIVRLWVFSSVLLLSANDLYAQEFKTVTKIKEDTVWLKWLPVDYNALLLLKNGATIRRIEVTANQDLNSQNYTSGKEWNIAPLEERFEALNREDSIQDRMATLLEPVVTPVELEAQNFAFGSVLIENVTHPSFQLELGNFIYDETIEKRKKYAYKIEIQNAEPLYVYVDPSEATEYLKPEIQLELDQKKTVVCSWDISELRTQYFAFDVEHAVSDTKAAKPLFSEPYLPFKSEFETNQNEAQIRHDDPVKGKMHYYRVIGRDAFGAQALASDWQGIYVPNRIDAYPVIDSIQAHNEIRYVHVKAQDFSGANENYQLLRSKQRDSAYEVVRASRITKDGEPFYSLYSVFTEEVTGDAYYYKVALVNEEDTVYSQPYYFFTLDQQAPVAPNGLQVTIDSSGIARLTWDQLNDSGLLGYRVFRGNSLKEEFVERTNQLSLRTSWTDTLDLNNLTPEVYYYIQGVDGNYNQGAHSDTIMGLKPDTIPPVSGIIRKISMVESGIELEMISSTSLDAVSNVLYRGDVALGEVRESYVDTNLIPGQFYTYHIRTVDRSGNYSSSKQISQMYEPGFRAAPSGTIKADFQGNFIEITYELPDFEIYSVQIFRGKTGESLRLWKTVHDSSQSSIQDRSVRIGETYNYQVKYITKDGVHSLPLKLEVQF